MRSGFEPLQGLTAADTAVFLDFDGTLAAIAERPEFVFVDAAVPPHLATIAAALDGALAIVTGREIADVDHFLAPLQLAASGVHGLERRDVRGRRHTLAMDQAVLAGITAALATFADAHEGLLLERKLGSLALHYRARPDLADACTAAVEQAVSADAGITILHGKKVIEIKAHAGTKGTAIKAFMAEPPFAGRRPVFLGDDVTDEAAFAEVNTQDGVSIKVGPGATVARYRLNGTGQVHEFLARLAGQLASATNLEVAQS